MWSLDRIAVGGTGFGGMRLGNSEATGIDPIRPSRWPRGLAP